MVQATLVGNQIEDGQKLLEELARGHFDVTAAGWIKASDENLWFLYIASKEVDEKGIANAYKSVLEIIRRMPELWIDPFRVNLVGAANPIARDMLRAQDRRRARTPTHFGGAHLGEISVEEAFIYPPVSRP